jgi:hypothetical protein
VFAGAIDAVSGDPADGAEVELRTTAGNFIARGLFNSQSKIRVRLYSWDPEVPNSWQTNANQEAVQLFFFLGTYHDHLAASPIGFTRSAGNFEAVARLAETVSRLKERLRSSRPAINTEQLLQQSYRELLDAVSIANV